LYVWRNRANVEWTLKQDPTINNALEVGPECPYFNSGFHTASMIFNDEHMVTALLGPHGERYNRIMELDESESETESESSESESEEVVVVEKPMTQPIAKVPESTGGEYGWSESEDEDETCEEDENCGCCD
jgi:hypothetical protein